MLPEMNTAHCHLSGREMLRGQLPCPRLRIWPEGRANAVSLHEPPRVRVCSLWSRNPAYKLKLWLAVSRPSPSAPPPPRPP